MYEGGIELGSGKLAGEMKLQVVLGCFLRMLTEYEVLLYEVNFIYENYRKN